MLSILPLFISLSLIPLLLYFGIIFGIIYFVISRVNRMLALKKEQNDLLREIIRKMGGNDQSVQ